MLRTLRNTRCDELFGNLHAALAQGKSWPPILRLRLTGIARQEHDGHLQLAVNFLGLDVTAAILQVLTTAAKIQLCLPLRAAQGRARSQSS